jgi:TetR/AcrR family transcriptional regulator, lmrAB and yxaGH operons repressor
MALLSVGEAHDLFQGQIHKTLTLWVDALAAVAIEAGVAPEIAHQRAEDAVVQYQGALVLARGLNDTTIFQRVLERLPEMLLSR